MKLLLIYDVPGWAWHHKAVNIQKYLSNDFEKIDICSLKDFHAEKFSNYHHVHIFGWMDRKGMAGRYKGFTTGVSSFNYVYKHLARAKKFMPRYDAITAVSKQIYNDLKRRKLNKHIYYCPNGVDESVFYPAPVKHDKFIVGWMGQNTYGGFSQGDSSIDMHGYQHVLLPLVESLKGHKQIEFRIMAKTFKNAVPHSDMVKWYNGLDLFLHTGFGTGTPNGIFEAMACGVPCVSTAIGEAPEVIEESYTPINGILIKRYFNKAEAADRVKQFKTLILWCEKDREKCKSMGDIARTIIEESWTWKQRAKNWLPVFRNHRKKL